MGPHRVASRGALGATGDLRPQGRRVAQTPRPQLEPDEVGEGLLGGTARGAPASDHLAQGHRVRQVRERGGAADLVHPALDEREGRLQPFERGTLLGGRLRCEHAAGQGALQGLGVGRVDRADGLLELLDVDRDAARVRLDEAQQVGAQPRHVREQARRRGLAQRQEQADLVQRRVEAFGEGVDVGGDEGRGGDLEQWQTDVGGAEHVAGEGARSLPHLEPEHGRAEPAQELTRRQAARQRHARRQAEVAHLLVEPGGVVELSAEGVDQR